MVTRVKGSVSGKDTVKYFATVADAQAASTLQVGDVVQIGERANALFDVIASTTNNGYDVIDGTGSSVSLQLRQDEKTESKNTSALGFTGIELSSLNASNKTKLLTSYGQRVAPTSNFSWLDVFPYITANGNVIPSERASSYAERVASVISAGTLYVDPINGNDVNTGTSPAVALQTLNEALRVRSQSRVFMMGSNDPANPNVFTKSDFRSTDGVGNRMKIVTALGHCRIAEPIDDFSGLTWTLESGQVYKATTTSAKINQLRYTRALDEDGDFLKVPEIPFNTDIATTVTDINNSVFGWYHDVSGNTLYVRIGSGSTFKDFIKGVVSDSSSRCLFSGTEISFYCPKGSSLDFNGVRVTPLQVSGTRPKMFMHSEEKGGITIRNCSTHGVDTLGAETYLQGVKLLSNAGDNIHYFDDGGVSSYGLEIDCESAFAGDFATKGSQAAGTDNGSSMHGTGFVARYGGDYYKNYGPDIVDSGSGESWNVGVKAYSSGNSSNGASFQSTTASMTMYLDSCHASSGQFDLRVDAGCQMYIYNTVYRTLNDLGTFQSYIPDNE